MRISRTTAATAIGLFVALMGFVAGTFIDRSGGEGLRPFAGGASTGAGPHDPDAPMGQDALSQGQDATRAPVPAHHGPYAALYAARDIRPALEDLKQRKVAGYGLMAAEGRAFCKLHALLQTTDSPVKDLTEAARTSGAGTDAVRTRQLEAVAAKCATFSSHELSAEDIAAEKALAASFDPSVALSRRLSELRGAPSDWKALGALADQVVDLGSPRLFGELYQALLTERQGEPVLLLGGRPHGGLSSAMVLQAWNLAACEVSGSCGLQNFHMQYDCALGASCFKDAREYHLVQAQLSEDTRAAFEQLRASILANLQARNWAYFGAP